MEETKKYQLLTNDSKTFTHPATKLPVKLYRIIALRKIKRGAITIQEGQIGGFVQSEDNLDQTDESWVLHEAMVFDKAFLTNNSIAMQKSAVFGNAKLDNTMVQDFTRIFGNAKLKDCQCTGQTDVYGNVKLEFTNCHNSVKVCGNADIKNSKLHHGAYVTDDAIIINSELYDASRVYGNSYLENCKLTSAVLVRDQKYINETLTRDIILNQSYPEIQGQF